MNSREELKLWAEAATLGVAILGMTDKELEDHHLVPVTTIRKRAKEVVLKIIEDLVLGVSDEK